ncbi:heme biosynthesis HemY N-terminal domain-containing protein [Vibrio ostreicida]|uniref:heme biosynthesis HemY N-terminal domain-containing protein n=1 Tax=Vibrio ostreicida TaxID=526588 RepID=UPI003B5BF713
MFRLLFLFFVLGTGLFTGTQLAGQQGYVLISVSNKTLEMSVTTLVLAIITMLAGLLFLEYLLKKLLYASSATRNFLSNRSLRLSRLWANEGIIKLLEGDFKGAEKDVMRAVEHHDMPLLCFLVASEAAQGLGDIAKRDDYLQIASEIDNSELAVGLTKAKQQVRQANYTSAFEILSAIKSGCPKNHAMLDLLQQVYLELERWQPLLEILPSLLKNKMITKEQQIQLTKRAQCGRLKEISTQKGSEELMVHWNSLPRKLKNDPLIVECLVTQLIALGDDAHAFSILKDSLKKHSLSELYKLLPSIKLPDTNPAIHLLENALSKNENNADAHSAIGHFYLQKKNWSTAQKHFEKALSLRSDISDYSSLADTLERQNMIKAANEVSKKVLTLVQA